MIALHNLYPYPRDRGQEVKHYEDTEKTKNTESDTEASFTSRDYNRTRRSVPQWLSERLDGCDYPHNG